VIRVLAGRVIGVLAGRVLGTLAGMAGRGENREAGCDGMSTPAGDVQSQRKESCAETQTQVQMEGACAETSARAQGEESCAGPVAQHQPVTAPPSGRKSAVHELCERSPAELPSPAIPRCLVGIRPDGGTTLRMRSSSGWTPEICEVQALATPAERPMTIGGRSALCRLRATGALEIHLPNQARLIVTKHKAEIVAEARALDLGGIVAWGAAYRASGFRVGRIHGVEVETASMKQDRIAKAPAIPVAACALLECLDLRVDRLEVGVRRSKDHGVDDAPEVRAEHLADLDHGRKPRVRHPFDQVLPRTPGRATGVVAPKMTGGLFHRPGACDSQRSFAKQLEPRPTGGLHVLGVLQPQIAGAFEQLRPLAAELRVLLDADLVDAVADVLGDVKSIERDLLLGVGHVQQRRFDVRRPHVHRYRPQRLQVLDGRSPVEFLNGILVATVEDLEDALSITVVDDRHVLVALLEGGLVNTDVAKRLRLSPSQTSGHGALHHPIDLIPSHTQHPGHRRMARFFEPIDDECLEHGREPRARIRPRHPQLLDPMLRALHPRHIGGQQRLVLHRVQVAPGPTTGVVTAARDATHRAGESHIFVQSDENLDLSCFEPRINIAHVPWGLDAKELRVEVSVPHVARSCPSVAHRTNLRPAGPHEFLKPQI